MCELKYIQIYNIQYTIGQYNKTDIMVYKYFNGICISEVSGVFL